MGRDNRLNDVKGIEKELELTLRIELEYLTHSDYILANREY